MPKTYSGECEMESSQDRCEPLSAVPLNKAPVYVICDGRVEISVKLDPGKWKVTAERAP